MLFNFKDTNGILDYVNENIFQYNGTKIQIDVYGRLIEKHLISGYLNAGILRVMDKYINITPYIDDIVINGIVDTKKVRMAHNKCAKIIKDAGLSLEIMQKVTIGINTVMTESAMLLRGIATRDISMLDIYELMTNDKEAYEILTQNDPVNNDMTPLEIVEKKEEAFTKLEGIIYKNKLEPFYTLLKAGSGIRLAQLVDTMCFIGCNPDWDVMIPHVVADSWLRGIGASNQDPKGAFYVTQLAARIAKKLEKCDIAITGWVLKQQMFIMKNTRVSEVEDCGTIHHTLVNIKSEIDIKRHTGMYYKIHHNQISYSRFKGDEFDLLGKSVLVRTPATCNTVNGDICKMCLGIDCIPGYDIGLEIGAFIYAMAGQNYLSAKHNTIANPLNPINTSDIDILKVTIQNKVRWLKRPSMVTVSLKIPTTYAVEFMSIMINLGGKPRFISLNGTYFYTAKDNIDDDGIIKDIDLIYAKNKNIPKAALFKDLQSVFYASVKMASVSSSALDIDSDECSEEDYNELAELVDNDTDCENNTCDIDLDKDDAEVKISDAPVQEIISRVYNMCDDNMHAIIPYMLVHKNIRDGHNLFKRPDFTSENPYAVFVSSRGLLKYLSITDSLPQGVSIGVDGILTSPETYTGERERDNSMDAIFVPRKNIEI